MRKILMAVTVVLATAVYGLAGVLFTAQTRSDAGGDVRVRAWVSGPRAKVVFLESDNQMYVVGDYMLSPDEGKTLFMVSPATRTYTKYDVVAMLAGMGGMVQGMRGTMKLSFESPQVEKLVEEDGGLVASLPTRHYRYRTSYSLSTQVAGGHKLTRIIEEDIWTTTAVTDRALAVWLKKEPPSTGDLQLDGVIRSEMAKVQGFPLKRITTTRETDAHGVEQTGRVEMEVTQIKQVVVPASQFVIPRNYTEVPPKRIIEEE